MKGFTSSVSFHNTSHLCTCLSVGRATMRLKWTHLALKACCRGEFEINWVLPGIFDVCRNAYTQVFLFAAASQKNRHCNGQSSMQLTLSPLQEPRGADPSVLDYWCCILPFPIHKAISSRHQKMCWESCVPTLGPGQRRKTLRCTTWVPHRKLIWAQLQMEVNGRFLQSCCKSSKIFACEATFC